MYTFTFTPLALNYTLLGLEAISLQYSARNTAIWSPTSLPGWTQDDWDSSVAWNVQCSSIWHIATACEHLINAKSRRRWTESFLNSCSSLCLLSHQRKRLSLDLLESSVEFCMIFPSSFCFKQANWWQRLQTYWYSPKDLCKAQK